MKFLFTLMLMICPIASIAGQTGSVYLAGNQMVAPQLTLQGDSIYVNNYLAWPYPHASEQAAATPVVTSPLVNERQAVKQYLLSIKARGQTVTSQMTSNAYARQPDVDSTWVDPVSGNVWIHWRAGFSEEVNPTTLLEPVEQPSTGVTMAQAMYEVWQHTLQSGGNIYIGWDATLKTNYYLLVPGPQVTFFDQGFRGQSRSLEVRQRFATRYRAVMADLVRPLDLNTMPRR